MRWLAHKTLRVRLTAWYLSVLAVILALYISLVFALQYAFVTRQMYGDEVQDVETVEGLLYFDGQGTLALHQEYFSQAHSHLLLHRLMEVRDFSGHVLYRSPTLGGMPLGGAVLKNEGSSSFNDRRVRLADGTHVFLISHVHPVQGHIVLIRLGYSLAPFRQRMLEFLGILLVALPVTLVAAGLAGLQLTRRALQPLAHMAERAQTITANNLHDRIEISSEEDELGHIGRVLNHLLDRLEQAFVQLQRFTADAAHELRTPLASLRAVGELALQSPPYPGKEREAIASILEEASRLNETIQALLMLARAEATQPPGTQDRFSLFTLTHEVIGVLEVLLEERNIRVEQSFPSESQALVQADRALMRTVVMNVLHNAVKFSPDGSVIRVSYSEHRNEKLTVELAVHDSGPGIQPAEDHAVFERFFTSPSRQTTAHSGTGLGLSIAKLVVERSGGAIFFDPAAQFGARCVIRLPAVPSTAGSSASSSTPDDWPP